MFGPDALRAAVVAPLARARLALIDCGREIPLEAPRELAAVIEAFLAGLGRAQIAGRKLRSSRDVERAAHAYAARMADNGKVVINLATGLEDPERVTVAFLVAGAAAQKGKDVAMFLTKEAVRLGLPGTAEAVACDGCPPLARLFQQYADAGGQLFVCPICFQARKLEEGELVGHARVAGATPLWDWIGEGACVFSY